MLRLLLAEYLEFLRSDSLTPRCLLHLHMPSCPVCNVCEHVNVQIKIVVASFCQQDAVSVMDRSLRHAEWITEVQWYYPRLYQSPGFRRLARLVKHQRVTLWPGGLGMSRFSVSKSLLIP